jgi:hypothetical protein
MQYPSDPKHIALIIVAILVLLMSPNFGCFFKIFDYGIVHLFFLFQIFMGKDTNNSVAVALVYMICVFQQQRIMMEELLDNNMANPDISTFVRYKLAMRIIANDTISDNSKSDFVIRSMHSKSKAIHRLNIMLAYMDKIIDPELKDEVLTSFFELKGKNTVSITKMMLDNKRNIQVIYDSLIKSTLDNNIKMQILKKMSTCDITDPKLKLDIQNLMSKKVSFDI